MFSQQHNLSTKKKSKSHGNRRLQRFKRKNRARGLDDDTIQNLLLNHPSHMTSNVENINENKGDGKDEETDQSVIDISDQNKKENTKETAPTMDQVR